MKKSMKILMVLGVILVSTTLASAALLQYFGKVTTTMNVKQSVVIGDEQGWYDYNQPIARDLGDVVHCTDYCYKLLIKNQACKDATVNFNTLCTASPVWNEGWDDEGIDISNYVFGNTQTITLVQKQVVFGQSPWLPLPDGMSADLTFNTCGENFDWEIISTSDLSDYSLIYYANYPEYWEEGPVTIIADLSAGTSGLFDLPTVPFVDDENTLRSINTPPINENYDHDFGAKFWLVPTTALTNNDVNWGLASEFLFETDLGFYMDCNNWSPDCLSNVFPLYTTNVLKAESTYCWISCFHVAFDIVPGTYSFETFVDATELPEVV